MDHASLRRARRRAYAGSTLVRWRLGAVELVGVYSYGRWCWGTARWAWVWTRVAEC